MNLAGSFEVKWKREISYRSNINLKSLEFSMTMFPGLSYEGGGKSMLTGISRTGKRMKTC